MEFLFDTTRTIESLLMNGTFSRYPNLHFIFSHGGGTMPVLANRMARTFPKEFASQVPNGVLYELKRQYYDTASATNPTSLSALLSVVPSSQVVFGSDFPFISSRRTGERSEAVRISPRQYRRSDQPRQRGPVVWTVGKSDRKYFFMPNLEVNAGSPYFVLVSRSSCPVRAMRAAR